MDKPEIIYTPPTRAVSPAAVAPPTQATNRTKVGCLWLRVADERDVFFAELIERSLPLHDVTDHLGIDKPTLGSGELWLDGNKQEFFLVDVDVANTVIEGYYQDESPAGNHVDYEVTIYLEVEE